MDVVEGRKAINFMQSMIMLKPKIKNKLPENKNFKEQPLSKGKPIALKKKQVKKMVTAVILEILGIKNLLSVFQSAKVEFQLKTIRNAIILKNTRQIIR